jgi:hypothetical protein
MPACAAGPEYFQQYEGSTVTWEPSAMELKRFKRYQVARQFRRDYREAPAWASIKQAGQATA